MKSFRGKYEKAVRILLLDITSELNFIEHEVRKFCETPIFLATKNLTEFVLQTDNFKPDLIISEAVFSQPDSWNILAQYAVETFQIPVIIFTSENNELQALKCVEEGAWDYVLKEKRKRFVYTILNALQCNHLQLNFQFAEKDLAEYEKHIIRYRQWEANIPAILFGLVMKPDQTFGFTYVSSACRKLLGCTPEDIVKDFSFFSNLIHSSDLSQLTEAIKLASTTLNPIRQEIRFLLDEEVRWFTFSSNPELLTNNDILWSGIIQDITDRKSVEEALSSEHNLMHVLMDNSHDVIYFKDLESRFIRTNNGYLKKFNIPGENDLIGKTDYDVFDPEHAESSMQDELEIIRTGKPLIDKVEKEKWKSGRTTWVSTTKMPLLDNNGKIIGTFGISRDVTERKLAEEELAAERNLLRTLIDALPDNIYVKDIKGRYLLTNKAHLNFTKASSENVKGKTNYELLDEDTANKFQEEDEIVFNGQMLFNHEVELFTLGEGTRWVQSTKLPLRNSDGEIIGLVGITHDATESKKIQEQLRDSESRLRYLISSTSAVLFNVIIDNGKARIAWIGDNVVNLLGFQPDEVLNPEWWYEVLHPDDKDYIESTFPLLFKENKLNLEFRLKHKEGHYVWLRAELKYVSGSEGTPSGVFGSWIDITERMMAQEALLKSEEQLSYALKTARLAYWEYDVHEDLLVLNDQLYTVLRTTANKENGYVLSSDEYISRFVHPDDVQDINYALQQAISAVNPNYSNQVEYRIHYADGEWGFVSVQIFITKNEKGETNRTFGVIQDITERRRNEEALRESEAQLSNALKIAHLAYWECDLINGIFTFNDQFYTLLKTTAEEQGGYSLSARDYVSRFVHPEDVSLVGDEISKAIETSDPDFSNYIEHRIIYADGQIGYFAVRYFILKDSEGKTIKSYGANQDITERRIREKEKVELENQLLQRNKELEKMLSDVKKMQGTLVQSEKMASLGQLSAGIAHEINNPLAFVCSNMNRVKEYFEDTVQLLLKWEEFKADIQNLAGTTVKLQQINKFREEIDFEFIVQDFSRMMISIQDGTQRIKKIVEGMRGFSHITENSFAMANINQAIEDTITIVWNELKYKAVIEKQFAVVPQVFCNIGEIKQVLVNLLVNAAHAIPEKGIIKIVTIVEKDSLLVKVSDTGCGIPAEIINRIFDPFYTTKPVGKGTGLGLWISSTIIEKHNGTLSVESQPGLGSTFIVKLPLLEKENINIGMDC